jgi:hypothetical protein
VKSADPRAALLRRVDGVPHVVLGPLLLAAVVPLERLTGVPRGAMTAILVPFTAYGVVVVAATHKRNSAIPPWLVPLAVVVNIAAVVVGSAGLTRRGLAPWGRVAGGGLALGAVRVLEKLRVPRT